MPIVGEKNKDPVHTTLNFTNENHDNTCCANNFKLTFTRQKTIICGTFFQLEFGNFPPKIGKKDTIWCWEYNRITAIKSAKNKPWLSLIITPFVIHSLESI